VAFAASGWCPVNRAAPPLIVAIADLPTSSPSTISSSSQATTSKPWWPPNVGISEAIERYYNRREELDLTKVMNEIQDEVEVGASAESEINLTDSRASRGRRARGQAVQPPLALSHPEGPSTSTSNPTRRVTGFASASMAAARGSMSPPVKLKAALSSRLSHGSPGHRRRRLPQDGRIKLKVGQGQEMDFRVSVLPTCSGKESSSGSSTRGNPCQLDMASLGFEPDQLADFKTSIECPYGMLLVTGPTGFGKTTTLYSGSLQLKNQSDTFATAEIRSIQPSRHHQVRCDEDMG